MLKVTKEIVNKATDRKFNDTEGRSFNWYVYDTFGQEMGFGSTDSFSLEVKEELIKLGIFDWTK